MVTDAELQAFEHPTNTGTPPPIGGPATGVALPGASGSVANPPPLPGSIPVKTAPTTPSFWNDPTQVAQRVLTIAAYDPQSAAEIWREYMKERNK